MRNVLNRMRVIVKIHRKLGCFEYKNDHNSKNKNQKIDFSFVLAHSTSFMQIWTLLMIFFCLNIETVLKKKIVGGLAPHQKVHSRKENCHYNHIPFNWKRMWNQFVWPIPNWQFVKRSFTQIIPISGLNLCIAIPTNWSIEVMRFLMRFF